jgi:hypothetical protein
MGEDDELLHSPLEDFGDVIDDQGNLGQCRLMTDSERSSQSAKLSEPCGETPQSRPAARRVNRGFPATPYTKRIAAFTGLVQPRVQS